MNREQLIAEQAERKKAMYKQNIKTERKKPVPVKKQLDRQLDEIMKIVSKAIGGNRNKCKVNERWGYNLCASSVENALLAYQKEQKSK